MTDSNLMEVEVRVEDSDTTVKLKLTSEEYQRAAADREYLESLVTAARLQELHPEPIIDDGENLDTLATAARLQEQHPEPTIDENKFFWKDNVVYLLLSLYEERIQDFENKRHKKVFQEIAKEMNKINTVSVTPGQCQTKINGLKKTYKKIKDHNGKSGNDPATWTFYERMDQIFGTSGWVKPVATASEAGPAEGESANTPPEAKKKRKLETVFDEFFEEKKKIDARKKQCQERKC